MKVDPFLKLVSWTHPDPLAVFGPGTKVNNSDEKPLIKSALKLPTGTTSGADDVTVNTGAAKAGDPTPIASTTAAASDSFLSLLYVFTVAPFEYRQVSVRHISTVCAIKINYQ
jgi:hypothetical protein